MSKYSFKAVRRGCIAKLWDYGWADFVCYRARGLEPGYEPEELFEAFMADRVFRDSWMVAESWKKETDGTHGPFVIDRLRPEHFKAMSFEELEAEIEQVLNDPGFTRGPDPEQRAAVAEWIDQYRDRGYHNYVLDVDVDDKRFHHDVSFVLDVFREFVVVDARAGELHQIVIGYD